MSSVATQAQKGPMSLRQLAEALAHGEVAEPLAALRRSGHAALAKGLNWPASKADAWRHTPIGPWAERTWQRPATSSGQTEGKVEPLDVDVDAIVTAKLGNTSIHATKNLRAVFVDGQFVASKSRLSHSGEVLVAPLFQAMQIRPELAQHLGRTGLHQNEAFAALNTANIDQGVAIYIGPGHTAKTPIEIITITTEVSAQAVIQPRILVVVGAHARAQVCEFHIGNSSEPVWTNMVTELVCEQGAHLEHAVQQHCGLHDLDLSHVGAHVGKDAHLTLTTLDVGARMCRRGVQVELAEPGAHASLVHLSLAGTRQHHDTQSAVRHLAPNTTSQQGFRCVAHKMATGVFGGMVEVVAGAQKMNAQQMSRGLLLAPSAQVLLRPQLIIHADDVKCSHGATVGQLDEDALFYLTSRGIDPDTSRQLLTLAFIGEALADVPESVAAALREHVCAWLGLGPEAAARQNRPKELRH